MLPGSACLLTVPRLMLVVCGLCLLMQGCASAVLRPVAESDKDPSGSFDGPWQVVINKAPGIQYGPGNWTFNCTGEEGELGLMVRNSVAQISFERRFHEAFVSQSGRFRFEVPLLQAAKSSGTSDSSLDRGEMTLIIRGSLDEGAGFLTWGVKEFANDGCTSGLDITRL